MTSHRRFVRAARHVLAAVLLLAFASSIGSETAETDGPHSRWYGNWVEATPAEVGYDAQRLEAAITAIGEMRGVQGLILLRHGYLVAERYWRGGAQDVPHNLKSASKSVMSALVGIAIGDGHLGLDQPVLALLPGRGGVTDPAKQKITVRHLLTMTSGLKSTSYQAYNTWVNHDDWIKSVLAAPLVSEPGSRYDYNTANTHLLSAILANRTGQTTRAFAQRELFDPMGIEIQDWLTDPDGIHVGGNNLWLKPRDFAKFGQLYLDHGRWGERQVLNADWVAASTRPAGHGSHETYGGYGYLWWSPYGDGSFAAVGYGGQYILVSPRDDTVLVITSTLVSKGDHWEHKLFGLLREAVGGSLIDPQLPEVVVTTADVELRTAPQGDASSLGKLPAGQRLELFGDDGDWLKVRVDGEQAWVRRDLIDMPKAVRLAADRAGGRHPSQDPGGAAVDAVRIPQAQLDRLRAQAKALDDLVHAPAPLARYRTTGTVNFRRSPNLAGDLIGKLKPGIEFQALERSEAWLMARIDGQQGWLHSDFAVVVQRPSPAAQRQAIAAATTALVDEFERLVPAAHQGEATLSNGDSDSVATQHTLARLQQELHEAEQRLEQTRRDGVTELEKLQDELAVSRQQVRSLGEELDRLQGDRDRQEKTLVQINAEYAALTRQLTANNRAITELESAVQQAQAAAESLAADSELLRNERHKLQQQLEALGEREQQRALALETAEHELTGLRSAAETAAAQRQQLEGQLQAALTQGVELETQLADLQQRNRQLVEQVEQVDQVREEQQQLIERLRGAEEETTVALNQSREQASTLLATVEEERRAKETLATELEGLREQFEARQQQLTALTEDDRRRQQQLADAQVQVGQLQDTLAQLRMQQHQATEQLAEADAGREQARVEVADLKDRLAQAQAARESLQSEIERKEEAARERQQQVTQLEQEQTRRVAELAAAQTEIAALREAAEQQLLTQQSLRLALEEAQGQGEARLAEAHRESQLLRQQLADQEVRRQQLEAASQDAEARSTGLAQQLAQREGESQRLRSELGMLAEKTLGMQQELAAISEAGDAQLTQLQEGSARIADLEGQLSRIGEERAMIDRRAGALEEMLLQSRLHHGLAVADLDQLRERSRAQDAQLGEAQQQIASLEQALQTGQQEKERMQAELAERESVGQSQAQLVAQLRDADGQRTQALRDVNARLEELGRQFEQIEAERQRLLAALEQGQEQAGSQRQLMVQLREAAAVQQAELDALEEQRDVQQRQLAEQAAAAEAQTEALEGARGQIASLERALREAGDERQAREREIGAQLVAEQAENRRLQLVAQAAEALGDERLEAEKRKANESLGEAQRTVAMLNEELQRLRDQNGTRDEELADLKVVKDQLQTTRSQLGMFKHAVDVAQQESRALLSEVQRLQARDRDRAEDMAKLLQSEERRATELTAATVELDALREAAKQQQAAEQALRATLEEMRDQSEARSAEAEADRERSRAQIAALQDRLAQAEAARESRYAEALRDANARLEELGRQFEQTEAERQRLLAALEQGQEQAGSQQQLMVQLRDAAAVQQAELDTLKQQRDLQQRQLAEQAAAAEVQAAALTSAREQIASLEGTLRNADEERQARGREISAQLVAQRAENRRLQEQLAEAQAVEAVVNEQFGAEKRRASKADESLREAGETIAMLNEDLQHLRDQNRSREEELEDLRVVRDHLQATQTQLDVLTRAVELGRQQSDALLAEVRRLQAVDSERLDEMAKLLQREERRAAELAEARTAIGALRGAAADRERAMAEVAALKDRLAQSQLSPELSPTDGESPRPPEDRAATRSMAGLAVTAPVNDAATLKEIAGPTPEESVVAETPSVLPSEVVSGVSAVSSRSEAVAIERFVSDWASAWSRQDVDDYLTHYADDFEPPDGLSRAAWDEQRRERLTRPKVISVDVSRLEVRVLDAQRARVSFDQAYRANHYRDRVVKTLALRRQEGEWKIQQETSRPSSSTIVAQE